MLKKSVKKYSEKYEMFIIRNYRITVQTCLHFHEHGDRLHLLSSSV